MVEAGNLIVERRLNLGRLFRAEAVGIGCGSTAALFFVAPANDLEIGPRP
jgi:hypothetical protein